MWSLCGEGFKIGDVGGGKGEEACCAPSFSLVVTTAIEPRGFNVLQLATAGLQCAAELATHFGISSSVQAFNVTVVLKLYIKLKHMIQILNIDGKMAG